MSTNVFHELESDGFFATFAYIATPSALYRAMRYSLHISRILDALASGELSEIMLRRYVEQRLKQLRPGEPFEFDLAFAAIAVSLEGRESPFVNEYLHGLAELAIREMPTSSRVARECLKQR